MNYTYDSVGNRTRTTSTLAPIPAGTLNYDPDDRLSTDTYDANGNTLTTTGNPNTNVYDFENHLIQQGQITIAYDGDGNRVSKSVSGVVTKYLVDEQNPTGYSQVVLEDNSATGEKQYIYGLQLLSERYQRCMARCLPPACAGATTTRGTHSALFHPGLGSRGASWQASCG